jgi:hypothetical protein
MDKTTKPSGGAPKGDTANSPMRQAVIDETIEGSFPASDPPSWTLGVGECLPDEPSPSEPHPGNGDPRR